jgi:antitoxin Phd
MRTWQVQDAKARFSELLDASLKEGPQLVTRRGVEAAVLVPIVEWRRLQQRSQPTLKDLLLGEGPHFGPLVPPRRAWWRRQPPVSEEIASRSSDPTHLLD